MRTRFRAACSSVVPLLLWSGFAAAVMLVIPAYIYNWKPIKEIAIFGELLAISAIVMCMLFVLVDVGRPDRVWHLMPFVGSLNLPSSILGWDVLVLNLYLVLNLVIVVHLLFTAYHKRPYSHRFVAPLLLFSIPAAVGIHTVTAFVYAGVAARPFWNSAILAPRFLASAFCSGPAILLILFQILRRTSSIEIKDEAIWKIAELMAYAMFLNLFLFGAEIFKEYYSNTSHLIHTQYLYSGIHGHDALVPYAWGSLVCSVVAFLLFLFPATRRNLVTLNLGCLLIYTGVYIEKGIALVIPGHDAGHPRRVLRVRADAERGAGRRRNLCRRLPGLHDCCARSRSRSSRSHRLPGTMVFSRRPCVPDSVTRSASTGRRSGAIGFNARLRKTSASSNRPTCRRISPV